MLDPRIVATSVIRFLEVDTLWVAEDDERPSGDFEPEDVSTLGQGSARPDVLQWINIIRTQSPIGDCAVLRVGVAHRIVELVVLRFAEKLAAFIESLEKETVWPLADQQDLHIAARLRLAGRSDYLGTVDAHGRS
jgi:hypothetical protein